MFKKQYYGILIVVIPFITGMYKELDNWSNGEIVGYNSFTVALIIFGIYYFMKHRIKKEKVDLTEWDIAVSKATIYLKSIKESNPNDDDVTKRVVYNELKKTLDLCHKNRNKKWKNQKEVNSMTSELISFVEGNKELIEVCKDIEL